MGHLGQTQDDFNVLGRVHSENPISRLTFSVNGGAPRKLRVAQYRRLVEDGDFNADIPWSIFKVGRNTVLLEAIDIKGRVGRAVVKVQRYPEGDYPLPTRIRWRSVKDPEDVGQYTDGRWQLTAQGLRTAQIGYDRIFLIGNRNWKDYEVTAQATIHALSHWNGPQSWVVRHVGFCMRWTGHSREDNLSDDQPKWGLHPRGGVLFLTIRDGLFPPVRQFYPGDSEKFQTFSPFPIELGRPFWMKGRCETLPDDASGVGVTRYSFKLWNHVESEPANWDFQVVQTSRTALRQGGVALVTHEMDVTIGDLTITSISGVGGRTI
jgi:hypothetical protein